MKINFSKKTHIFFYIMLIVFSLQVFAINKPCLAKDTNRTNKISILYTTDDGYFAPTIVSMESALQSMSKDTFYDFHLMVNGEFSKTNDLERFKNKNEDKCSITTHDMGDDFKNDWTSTWPPSMYYRLKAASVLSGIDKCVYIDGDTLIVKDLSELFNINLEENYIGGILDIRSTRSFKNGICCNNYINSGVALLNLKKIREDDKEKELLQKVKENSSKHLYTLPDQDIYNIVFKDKIKLLPLKYNFMSNLFMRPSPPIKKPYSEAYKECNFKDGLVLKNTINIICISVMQIDDMPDDYPVIVHFTHNKPWNSSPCITYTDKSKIIFENSYSKWHKIANSVEKKYGIYCNKSKHTNIKKTVAEIASLLLIKIACFIKKIL